QMIELSDSEPRGQDGNYNDITEFPRITNDMSYNDFFREHLEANKPCVFSGTFTKDWKARSEWVTDDGQPKVNFFKEHFGAAEVPVANCDQKHYDSQEKKTYKINDYIHYWESLRDPLSEKKQCLYLKDWHFVRDFPNYEAYITPKYFASDWLNEFWETRDDIKDDYRFVYIGPKQSWTPFHADVFRSYSWSANVCGRKRWVFYPPGQDVCLRDTFGSIIYDVDSTELK
ncbi:unnamed protein product, partial [Meganyctiphanes norvegica]